MLGHGAGRYSGWAASTTDAQRRYRWRVDTLVGTTVLGGLEVVREIGRGGYATVYEVRLRGAEVAALKVLHPSYLEDARAAARLFREALVTERASSPRVVQVYGVGTLESGAAYVLMEMLEGRTLADRLSVEGVLAPHEAVRLAAEVAEGLGAAHEVGVVHRDVKPSNIFLVRGADGRETAKVLDFGISKLLPGAEDRFGALTKSGAILGTPRYLSPEQAASEEPTSAADQYALGVTLYEMLSGRVPYDVINIAQGIADILTGRPTPLADVAPSIEPALAALVMRALRRDPGDRFDSMRALREALSPFAATATPAARRDESAEAFATTLGLDVVALRALDDDVLPLERAARVGLRPERRPVTSSWSHSPPAAAVTGPESLAPAARARVASVASPHGPPLGVASVAPPPSARSGHRLLPLALAGVGFLSVLVAALVVGGLLVFSRTRGEHRAAPDPDRPAPAAAERRVASETSPASSMGYGPDVADPNDPRPVLRQEQVAALRDHPDHWDQCVHDSHRFQDTGRNVQIRIWCAHQAQLADELRESCEFYVTRWPRAWVPAQCHGVVR